MRRIELDVDRESSPEWFEIRAELRGHYHALLVYCARVENGGLLAGAREWNGRRWWAAAGLTRRDVDRLVETKVAWGGDCHTGLCSWHGDHLVVQAYPRGLEVWVRAERERKANYRQSLRSGGSASADASADGPRTETRPVRDTVRSGSGSGSDPDLPTPIGDPPPPVSAATSAREARAAGDGGGGGGLPVGKGKGKGRGAASGPDGFEKFWALHPKGARQSTPSGRDQALGVWAARDLEPEAAAIIAYVRKPPAHWRREDGRFALNPVSFLQSAPWRRPPPPAPPAPAPIEVYERTSTPADRGWKNAPTTDPVASALAGMKDEVS